MDLSSLAQLQTEGVNPRTIHIDRMSTLEMCTVINSDDHLVAESVKTCLPEIAKAIDALVPRVRRGGRVVYVGAGTSGRCEIPFVDAKRSNNQPQTSLDWVSWMRPRFHRHSTLPAPSSLD